MDEKAKFIELAGLINEPTRASMLWNLLDGRAYTASELAIEASISASAASNHLSKLLEANLIKVEKQGRHRYFTFSRPEVAYTIESLASLVEGFSLESSKRKTPDRKGITYCRTCYDHLAGYTGVQITDALINRNLISMEGAEYRVTENGWNWAAQIGIYPADFTKSRRPIARQCLDWSERRMHIAGQFGARLLTVGIEKQWYKSVQHSRVLIPTAVGRKQLHVLLGLDL